MANKKIPLRKCVACNERKDITKIRMPQKKFLPKQKHQQKKRR